jgi:hypothetical protein
MTYVPLEQRHFRMICSIDLCGKVVELDGSDNPKAGLLETERQAAASGEKIYRSR